MKSALLFTLCFIGFSLTTSAQSREATVLPVIEKRSVGIDKATGWQQDRSGQWVSNQNLIAPVKLTSKDLISQFNQNFLWLRMATVNYKGKKYYMLYYYCLRGEFKYPSLKEDWFSYNSNGFMLVDPDRYTGFKNAVLQKTAGDIKLDLGMSSDEEKKFDFNEEFLMTYVQVVLDYQSVSAKRCFTANVQKQEGKDVVRFRLPENCDAKPDFAKEYFEVSLDDFKKLLIE